MIAFDRVLAALEADGRPVQRRRQDEARSRCPAHDGQSADSLAVRSIEGQALIHCFGGCEPGQVMAALGLDLADLFDEPSGAKYDYADARGTLVRTVHRSPDKRFRQSGSATRGPSTLYRLPQVLEAVAAGHPIYITEGEKDVLALEAIGAVATTAPMGAGNWNKVDASPLAGADVVVVPDRDQTGNRYLADVLATLRPIARSVRVVRAATGKDAADHVAAGHTLGELVPVETPADATKYESNEGNAVTQEVPRAHEAMFHGPIGEAVRRLEAATEAHPVAILVQILALVGAIVGAGPHVVIGGSHHPARVWPLVMGATSKGRKGESRAQAVKFVTAFTSSSSYFVKNCMTSGLSSGEGLLSAFDDHEDGTPADRRLAVTETEFARVLAVGKREGNTLPTILRELWDDGRARTMTRAAPLKVDDVHLVVIGHVTPRELRLKLSEADVSGGTLNRFLPVLVQRTQLLPEPPEPPDLTDLVKVLDARLATAHVAPPRRYTMTAPARAFWATAYRALDQADTGGLLSEVLGRAPAYVQRLALVYAIADGATEIDVAHLRAGLALVKYATDSCRAVFGDSAGTGDLTKLSGALQQAHRLSQTQIAALFGRNKLAAAITVLTDELVATGYAIWEEEKHEKGRPTTWLIWAGKTPADHLDRALAAGSLVRVLATHPDDASEQLTADLSTRHLRRNTA